MRKLLLGTTALAAATAMSASALADVSIAGSYEFKYKSEYPRLEELYYHLFKKLPENLHDAWLFRYVQQEAKKRFPFEILSASSQSFESETKTLTNDIINNMTPAIDSSVLVDIENIDQLEESDERKPTLENPINKKARVEKGRCFAD